MVFDLAGANTDAVISNIGISGSGSFAKSGSGSIGMYTTNSYTGGTILNAGLMNISSGAPNPFGSLATQIFTYNGGTLQTNSGAMTLANNVTLNATLALAANSTSTTLNGTISGTGGINKSGTGVLTLGNANNSYSGGTTISGGTLSQSSLPSAAGNSVIGTGNLSLDTGGMLSYTVQLQHLIATLPLVQAVAQYKQQMPALEH